MIHIIAVVDFLFVAFDQIVFAGDGRYHVDVNRLYIEVSCG